MATCDSRRAFSMTSHPRSAMASSIGSAQGSMRLLGIFVKVRVVNAAAKKAPHDFCVVAAVPLHGRAALATGVERAWYFPFDHHGPSLANYKFLFYDSMFWLALANNLLVPIGSLVIEFVLGLALALALYGTP